jgi:hypothetical protein
VESEVLHKNSFLLSKMTGRLESDEKNNIVVLTNVLSCGLRRSGWGFEKHIEAGFPGVDVPVCDKNILRRLV